MLLQRPQPNFGPAAGAVPGPETDAAEDDPAADHDEDKE
jgi:hypothetical protein